MKIELGIIYYSLSFVSVAVRNRLEPVLCFLVIPSVPTAADDEAALAAVVAAKSVDGGGVDGRRNVVSSCWWCVYVATSVPVDAGGSGTGCWWQ